MNKTCELCQSDEHTHFVRSDAKTNVQLNLIYCSNCSLVQQKELPSDEELNLYYSHNYRRNYKGTYTPKPKYIHRAGLAALNRIEFLESTIHIAHQTLLDIGAGGGEFVYLANKRGFNAKGIEPNVGYSEFSQEQYGVEVQTAMLSELENSSADILTMFHVFEHMSNPHDVMRKLYSIVKNNGYLFIEVPNILQADASPHNIYFKAHLFYYSRFTLNSLASVYFDLVKVDDTGNLKILFKKKSIPSQKVNLPTTQECQIAKNRMSKKGWLEYLFIGGGIFKPFLRIEKIIAESLLNQKSPRQILDDLYKKRHRYSNTPAMRKVQKLGRWSSLGGVGFLYYEVFC
jgi:2-polyprenyl-3-methyl-5-hydroxy-6-metoxy-1,4-benzoquinol methylase